jgi:hypothetical protein
VCFTSASANCFLKRKALSDPESEADAEDCLPRAYSSASSAYSPVLSPLAFSPASPPYSPASPAYFPLSPPAYSPASPAYFLDFPVLSPAAFSPAYFSDSPDSEDDERPSATLLEVLAAWDFKFPITRHGARHELNGTDGKVTVKINLDLVAPAMLVVVLEGIVVKRRFRRTGVASQFVRNLATIFRAKPVFSSLKVESVLTLEMAALCRKEGMVTTDDSDFYLLLK